ncbi:MAG: hypothetical protein GX800_04890 [Clostridiaceae bacterium]|nr:hypothetical protein [Clostridiaceae bacterium]
MAATAITPTALTGFNKAAALPATAAVAANEGALIAFSKADQKGLIILENSDATDTATAIITKGDALQGTTDLSITIQPSATAVVAIESMKYKYMTGATTKGKVLVKDTDTTATTLKVAAVYLP